MIQEIAPGSWQPGQAAVFVFQFSLLSDPENFLSLLDREEKDRAERFYFEADRRKFIVAHGQTRHLLSQFTRRKPVDLKFSKAGFGKPYLSDQSWYFNLSHSGDYGLLAVAGKNELGVDIERHHPQVNDLQIARRFFSEPEQAHLFALPPAEQKEAFFRVWARKEAVIKAIGHGLQIPLSCFDVEVHKNEPAGLHRLDYQDYEPGGWSMYELPVPAGYNGALVVHGMTDQIAFVRIQA